MLKAIHAIRLIGFLSIMLFCVGAAQSAYAASVTIHDAINISGRYATMPFDISNDEGIVWYGAVRIGTVSGNYNTAACDVGWKHAGSYSCTVSTLFPDTTYYARADITDGVTGSIRYYSNEIVFHTPVASVVTGDSSNITGTGALLSGTINNDVGIQWGGTIQVGTTSGTYNYTSCSVGWRNAGDYACNVFGLSPNTTYYYRAVIYDSIAASLYRYGEERSFHTPVASVVTGDASNIMGTRAALSGTIDDDVGIQWGGVMQVGTISGAYNYASCTVGLRTAGEYTCTVSGLSPDTTYYYRAVIYDGITASLYRYGEERSFHTAVPVVTTGSVANVTGTSVTFNSAVTNDVGITWLGYVQYGTSSGVYTAGTCSASNWQNAGSYACNAAGLLPNTTYYYRAYMRDGITAALYIYGSEMWFRTPSSTAIAPIITSLDISDITINAALGTADITNTNNQDATKIIEWGTQTGVYTSGSCTATNMDTSGKYYCTMTNLSPDTTYFIRAKATNSIGTTYGTETTFTTLPTDQKDDNTNLNLTISENLTLNCGSIVDLDNGTTLTAGNHQTNTTTCQVTTNDQEGYNLSLTHDRATNNALYHTTQSTSTDGQIQDKTPWNSTTPNAQAWNGTGLGFGLLSSTATKNTSWWGNANSCNDTTQLYAGLPDTDTNIMEHTTYSNTHTDTVICYKLDIPSTQLSGEYEGSVTYTAAGRP